MAASSSRHDPPPNSADPPPGGLDTLDVALSAILSGLVPPPTTAAPGRPPARTVHRRAAPTPTGGFTAPLTRAGDARTLGSRDPRLQESVNGLRSRQPHLSAATSLSRGQRRGLLTIAGLVLTAFVADPATTMVVLVAFAVAVYLLAIGYRLLLMRHALSAAPMVRVDDAAARSIPADELPVYTVIVPVYREPEVVVPLLAAIEQLEYPSERLDVKLVVEDDDDETLAVLAAARPGPHIEVVRVPAASPRTKPKACNYALAAARGDLVTIYDAEDRPEPLQLRRAAAALARLGPEVACLQAKLAFYNPTQNRITRWFAVEYGAWFSQFLPALVTVGAPIPLGGTSNHFRREALAAAGGWDPYNVTEDADLGIRLHRLGYRVEILDSTTYEEANSDFVNWIKQRSRWHKGYLQTWMVHMRRPRQLWRELGPSGFLGFNLFVGASPTLAVLNPVFWGLTLLWFVGKPAFIKALFPGPVLYAGLLCFVVGNFSMVYLNLISVRANRRPELLGAALLTPVYWLMMSLAGIKAVVQLLLMPSYWEKTAHGLDSVATVHPIVEPQPLGGAVGGL
jgi:cellulose synthase/poly-beta-1,6-N-acetylglucosamine synthase-like glycosyltransferase